MQRYLEIRAVTSSHTTVGSDLARHLLARQHVGKTVVLCDKPVIVMSVVRKYWFRLTRNLQKERSSTLNAEKILQLTYDITHMQHMEFIAKPFRDQPQADVFFVTPEQCGHLPATCSSLYILCSVKQTILHTALQQLPNHALVIDYSHDPRITSTPLLPKYQLEQLVSQNWQRMEQFFDERHIDIRYVAEHMHSADVVNGVVDNILGVSSQFMRLADDFLELLRLAQPLSSANSEQQLYDLVALLNRKIYALTPGILSQQFILTLSVDDELSLHDIATEDLALVLSV